jgi:hypothetical protein
VFKLFDGLQLTAFSAWAFHHLFLQHLFHCLDMLVTISSWVDLASTIDDFLMVD